MMKNTHKNYQSGNAIVIIFIAIALFAALAVVFNQSSRTSTGFISDAQIETAAKQIISYSNQVKDAVKRLQLRGCADTEISFENTISTLYTNPNSPADNSCHVFDTAGGGIKYQVINNENLFTTTGGVTGHPRFHGNNQIANLGSNDADGGDELVMRFLKINDALCLAINDQLGIINPSGTPPEETSGDFKGVGPFQGTYNINNHLIGTSADIRDRKSICVYNSNTTYDAQNLYYQVLITR